MAAGTARSQDRGVEWDDRPRHRKLGRKLIEVPVGFKMVQQWPDRRVARVRRRGKRWRGVSARDGTVWTTDKDGLIMGLLAAEMTARTGRDPNLLYASVTRDLGNSFYARIDAPASPEQKSILAKLDPAGIDATELAGEPIKAKLSRAPATTRRSAESNWSPRTVGFAARPSGTEDVYKILCGKLPKRRSPQANST